MAVSNSWLEYVNDAKQLKIKKKDTLVLLGFRMRLAKELILLGKTVITPSRKVGRPSSRTSPNLQKKLFSPLEKKKIDSRPLSSIQHDNIGHLPQLNGRKEATRCKYEGCKGRTHGKGTVTDSRGVTFGIVDKPMRNYLEKGHILKNRKENPSITAEKLKKGEAVRAQKNNEHVIKWVDKREVSMISTKYNLGFENVTDKFGRQKFKPTVIVDYNNHMSGRDRADQMMSYYPMPRKCMRWYIKVFFHLVDICLWNSNYLYNLQVSKLSI
ncbi:hypothetical protein AGLY_014172 [Aphis glycines]|uniref:PiggyBac transposable element-derived protein domain-containing protein n=1 Tax=Aphis glycines TaxID=307491 RepID=A0A6G0T5L9_APHGL|nr:hypothetical protein AGLY_014172 [Aphis glycines]